MDKTIFGRIIDREIPATIVHEDELCVAFEDVHPVAPTHVLVVPRKPIDRVSSASEADEKLLGHLLTTAASIAKARGIADFRLVTNNGAGAGQSVFHLHVHLIAGRKLGWPPG
ncbi:MAG: histidine triad nucleotide-binding protein [Deltaproteobacteria bacterium]|nr:histidine triad nucleotide-binding protein [Deltaproteobacteria bacterium]